MAPGLSRSCAIAQAVDICSDPLGPVAFVNIFIIHDTDNGGLGLIDRQGKDLMIALVDPPALYKVIAIRGNAAFETALLHKLAQGGFCADRGLFAFPVRLPETDIVRELVGMIVKALLALLCAPDLYTILGKPLHHKGGFVSDPPDTVKHKHQENVKLAFLGPLFYELDFATVFGPYFMAGDTVLLFLKDDFPAHLFCETVTGFPLHGNVGLGFIVIRHLLVGRYSVKAMNTLFAVIHSGN